VSITRKIAIEVTLLLVLLSLGGIARATASVNEEAKKVEQIHKYVEREIEELPPFPRGNPNPTLVVKKPVQRLYAAQAVKMTEAEALNWIIKREGGATSVNRSSLACGLAQSLPCSKILTYAGVDLSKYDLTTYNGVKAAISTVPAEVQRAWMLQYCVRRYGSVVKAVAFWQQNHWY
jgi:hypothetical protein